MNKYIIYLVSLGLLILTACDPKTFDPVLQIGDSSVFSAPASGTAIVMTEDNVDSTLTFAWSQADFGFEAAVRYALEMDEKGNDFASTINLGTFSATMATLTYDKLNSSMIGAGFPNNTATTMEVRVVATVSDEVDPVFSDPIDLDLTPFKQDIIFPILAVPGSYQGWEPTDSSTAIYDRSLNDQYEGFLFFDGPGVMFKFTDGTGWDTNWGDDGADGVLDPGGADIAAPGEGMHFLQVNLSDLTFSAEVTNWGMLGSATPGGFDTDIDMTYDETTGHLTLTTDLTEGEIKFRANDDWAINFGDNDTNGSLEFDGANIPISDAGNYTIELIITNKEYSYTITKN